MRLGRLEIRIVKRDRNHGRWDRPRVELDYAHAANGVRIPMLTFPDPPDEDDITFVQQWLQTAMKYEPFFPDQGQPRRS